MPPQIHQCRRQAWSLVEILVTLALAAILVSVLIAAAGHALEGIGAARCTANLRQLTIVALSFAGDNRGELPSYRNDDLDEKYWFTLLYKRGYLQGQAPENSLLFCPSGPKPTTDRHTYGYRDWEGAMIKQRSPLSLTRIPAPSKFWFLADSIRSSGSTFIQSYSIQKAGMSYGGITLQHRGKGNVAFADGHVELVDEERAKFLAEKEPEFAKERLEVRGADGRSLWNE